MRERIDDIIWRAVTLNVVEMAATLMPIGA
jgi:hypothetical protein